MCSEDDQFLCLIEIALFRLLFLVLFYLIQLVTILNYIVVIVVPLKMYDKIKKKESYIQMPLKQPLLCITATSVTLPRCGRQRRKKLRDIGRCKRAGEKWITSGFLRRRSGVKGKREMTSIKARHWSTSWCVSVRDCFTARSSCRKKVTEIITNRYKYMQGISLTQNKSVDRFNTGI